MNFLYGNNFTIVPVAASFQCIGPRKNESDKKLKQELLVVAWMRHVGAGIYTLIGIFVGQTTLITHLWEVNTLMGG